ncbi:MAG: hypothetical protein V4689_14330 [Verrucomicrobiota bacterium]
MTRGNLPTILRLAGLWVIYVVWCQIAGWALSWAGSLNRAGYGIATPFLLAAAFTFWRSTRPHRAASFSSRRWLRRLRRQPSFAAWAIVTGLVLLGALMNPPSNYDGLTYRLPKLLYWLQENRWHWIDGIDFRLNITGAGIEWMSVPLILLTKSDRGLFLLNFVPFLLLPGLFFVAARGWGIRSRANSWWMWVWPTAYGVATQAGSIGNDMLAAALGLASLAFAAGALRNRPALCLACSALAAAAMTAVKATTLPLGLPLVIYWLWVGLKVLGPKRLLAVGGLVAPFAVIASFLPIALLCWKFTGRWNGNPNDQYGFEPKNPAAALIGNSLDFTTSLFSPPIAPGSEGINAAYAEWISHRSWYPWVKANYGCFAPGLFPDLPTEEGSGIGLGITLVLAIWILLQRGGYKPPLRSGKVGGTLIFPLAVLAAMLAFLGMSGIGGTPRLMVPFIPFILLAVILVSSRNPVTIRTPHWLISLVPALFLLPTLCLNPNRPLIPESALVRLPGVPAGVKSRMTGVYQTYARRGELLAPLRVRIPLSERIGFAGGGDNSAYALFKPFGTRQVVNLSPRSEAGLKWVVATREGLERRLGIPLETWEQRGEFTKVREEVIVSRVSTGPETWLLYHRNP